jgi:hypothetical protein
LFISKHLYTNYLYSFLIAYSSALSISVQS